MKLNLKTKSKSKSKSKSKAQKGGVKLVKPEKPGFRPIFEMLQIPTTGIKVLADNSLKGFLVSVDMVPNGNPYYKNLNPQLSHFTKDEYNFLLKFAIVTPDADEPLPAYNNAGKSSESKQSFFAEAKIQQHIWEATLRGGREPVAPSLANFTLFPNGSGLGLIEQTFIPKIARIRHQNGRSADAKSTKTADKLERVFSYLKNTLEDNSSYSLGVIVMPYIDNTMTLGDFINTNANTNSQSHKKQRINVYANIISQIIRLFMFQNIIHFDLHLNNSLVYNIDDTNDPDGENIKTLIIDFGRADSFSDKDVDGEYINTQQKAELLQLSRDAKRRLGNNLLGDSVHLSNNNHNNPKAAFIDYFLKKIMTIEHSALQAMFAMATPSAFQSDWINNTIESHLRTPIYTKAYDILHATMTTVPNINMIMQPDTIRRYKADGNFVNFGTEHAPRGPDDFIDDSYRLPRSFRSASLIQQGVQSAMSMKLNQPKSKLKRATRTVKHSARSLFSRRKTKSKR